MEDTWRNHPQAALEAATRREITGLSSLILTGWVKLAYYAGLLIMDLIQILQ
jgi:hypothetical protein